VRSKAKGGQGPGARSQRAGRGRAAIACARWPGLKGALSSVDGRGLSLALARAAAARPLSQGSRRGAKLAWGGGSRAPAGRRGAYQVCGRDVAGGARTVPAAGVRQGLWASGAGAAARAAGRAAPAGGSGLVHRAKTLRRRGAPPARARARARHGRCSRQADGRTGRRRRLTASHRVGKGLLSGAQARRLSHWAYRPSLSSRGPAGAPRAKLCCSAACGKAQGGKRVESKRADTRGGSPRHRGSGDASQRAAGAEPCVLLVACALG
jgi:hypothetical protein